MINTKLASFKCNVTFLLYTKSTHLNLFQKEGSNIGLAQGKVTDAKCSTWTQVSPDILYLFVSEPVLCFARPGVNFIEALMPAFFLRESAIKIVLALKTPLFGNKYLATCSQFNHFCCHIWHLSCQFWHY